MDKENNVKTIRHKYDFSKSLKRKAILRVIYVDELRGYESMYRLYSEVKTKCSYYKARIQ